MTVLGEMGVEATQWVSGSLSSKIVFNYVRREMHEVERRNNHQKIKVCVVLDNSPLNRSNKIQKMA